MANFVVGDKVRTTKAFISGGGQLRLNGRVKYTACQLATGAGGKICDKKTCVHQIQDYCWVEWPVPIGAKAIVFSYHRDDLEYDTAAAPKPVAPDAEDFKNKAADISKKIKDFVAKDSDVKFPAPKSDDIDWDMYNGFKPGNPLLGGRGRVR